MGKTKNVAAKAQEPAPDEPSLDEVQDPTPQQVEEALAELAAEEPSLDEQEPEAPEEFAPVPEPIADPTLNARAAVGSKAEAMKEALAAEPKVRVFIPLANGEKQGVTQSVILNGYPMYIRKGTYVNVAQSVADVLEIKLKHKMTVENHPSRLSGDGKVQMTGYGSR